MAACGGVPLFVDDWGNPCSRFIFAAVCSFLCILYLSRVSTYMYTGIQYLMIYCTHTSIQTIVCFSL